MRYLLEQAWPAVESEPLLERERLAEQGRRFHKLIQQHVEGLPEDVLTPPPDEPDLARWWQSYLDSLTTTLSDLPIDRRAEVALSIPIKTYRLTAHFDLIAVETDRAVIVDWKTEQRLPTREQLLKRMQTRVYRYVLTVAQQRPPGTVSMIYWFAHAERPDQPIALPYDAAQQADDHQYSHGPDRRDRAARSTSRRVGHDVARTQVRLLRVSFVVSARRAGRHAHRRRRRSRSGRPDHL